MLIIINFFYYHANLQLQKEVGFCQVGADFRHTLSSDKLLFAAITAKMLTVRKQIKWALIIFPASVIGKVQQ